MGAKAPPGVGDRTTVHVGLDEAGRGSLVGPLVVGAFALPDYTDTDARKLVELGVRDSKLLSPSERRRIFGLLRQHGSWATASASPERIDRYVHRGKLNFLEVDLMASLVVRLGAHRVEVDACDPDAERFGRVLRARVEEHGGDVRVLSRHKADRDLPLVGAASIVAKVTRDRAIERIRRQSGLALGSGYPSDRTTRDCVEALVQGGKIPRWVRRSWKTFDTLNRTPSLRPLEDFVE